MENFTDYSSLGRQNGGKCSQRLWCGVTFTPPDLSKSCRSNSLYDLKKTKFNETSSKVGCHESYAARTKNGSKFNHVSTPTHIDERAEYDMNHFPILGDNHVSCPDLHVTSFFEPESVDSVSVDYEPTPKKGHYRIIKRDNKRSSEPRGFKNTQGDSQSSKRRENHPIQKENFKGKKFHPSGNGYHQSQASFVTTSHAVDDYQTPNAPFYCRNAVRCNHCNSKINQETLQKKRVVSDTSSINFQQFLLKVFSSDTSLRCSPRYQPLSQLAKQSEETGDFLTPMLINSAYFDRSTSNVSSQILLSILAENLALNMSDVEFFHFLLRQRKRRMSYTKSFVDIITRAAGDLKLRPPTSDLDPRFSEFPSPLRAESKRFRSIYTNA